MDFVQEKLIQATETSSISLRLRTRPCIQFPRLEGQGLFFLGPYHVPRMSVLWGWGFLSPVSRRMPNTYYISNSVCQVNDKKVNKAA